MKHKGHEYKVVYCDPSKDWGEHKGMFHIDCAIGNNQFFSTYAEAESIAIKIIDEFTNEVPQTKAEWISAIEGCMVWTGYEDCHLDDAMVWSLLLMAAKHIKEIGDET